MHIGFSNPAFHPQKYCSIRLDTSSLIVESGVSRQDRQRISKLRQWLPARYYTCEAAGAEIKTPIAHCPSGRR